MVSKSDFWAADSAAALRVAIQPIKLAKGSHTSPDGDLCAMEAIAKLTACPHSDSPDHVSPSVGAFVRSWQDSLDDADRERLVKPVLHMTAYTRGTEADEIRRFWMVVDWQVRVFSPAMLRLTAGLKEHEKLVGFADQLEGLAEMGAETWAAAATIVSAARSAARSAAWSAAGSAAWSAARSAARSAAWYSSEIFSIFHFLCCGSLLKL